MPRKLTTEEFIIKANERYNDKFIYDKFIYENAKTHGIITCPKHGDFTQSPDKHLNAKYSCPICNEESRSHRRVGIRLNHTDNIKSFEKFCDTANERYNNKFQYKLNCKWIGFTKTTIIIICPIHGEFESLAINHLQHTNINGCVKCANIKRVISKTSSYDDAIKEVTKLYDGFYTYPNENKETYHNKQSIIDIICPIHGSFNKKIQKHVSGQACFDCKVDELVDKGILVGGYSETMFKQHPEMKDINATLYYLKINDGKYYKIGITKNDVKNPY